MNANQFLFYIYLPPIYKPRTTIAAEKDGNQNKLKTPSKYALTTAAVVEARNIKKRKNIAAANAATTATTSSTTSTLDAFAGNHVAVTSGTSGSAAGSNKRPKLSAGML